MSSDINFRFRKSHWANRPPSPQAVDVWEPGPLSGFRCNNYVSRGCDGSISAKCLCSFNIISEAKIFQRGFCAVSVRSCATNGNPATPVHPRLGQTRAQATLLGAKPEKQFGYLDRGGEVTELPGHLPSIRYSMVPRAEMRGENVAATTWSN